MKKSNFIDEIEIQVKPGSGGDGMSSFLRQKYMPNGGPSGGNGGEGGAIYFRADHNLNTLLHFSGHKHFQAENGGNGGSDNKTGKSGKDLYILVPIGTEIIVNDQKIGELLFHNQILLFSKGGKGGRGNASFKSAHNNAPTLFEKGEAFDWTIIKLNLKVLADVGLLGFPNAGKSTFLSVVSNAKPKIADYPFTTLVPQLGMVKYYDQSFVITDLPGLIEGAHENKGMGIEFLKHLSRTKVILHMIDGTEEDPKSSYLKLRNELSAYSSYLETKPEIIVISKEDLISNEEKASLVKTFKEEQIFFISSMIHKGLEKLYKKIIELIKIEDEKERLILMERLEEEEFVKLTLQDFEIDKSYEIFHPNDNHWVIKGNYIKYWVNRIPLTNYDNFLRLWAILKKNGVIDKLNKKGLKANDIITVEDTKFIFEYND